MSAAEKLERLATREQWRSHDSNVLAGLALTVEEALPEIIAVVKAAENVTFYGQEAHRYNEWHGSQIVLALSALDEKLGDVTP